MAFSAIGYLNQLCVTYVYNELMMQICIYTDYLNYIAGELEQSLFSIMQIIFKSDCV